MVLVLVLEWELELVLVLVLVLVMEMCWCWKSQVASRKSQVVKVESCESRKLTAHLVMVACVLTSTSTSAQYLVPSC